MRTRATEFLGLQYILAHKQASAFLEALGQGADSSNPVICGMMWRQRDLYFARKRAGAFRMRSETMKIDDRAC